MILKYTFGQPFDTGAAVLDVPEAGEPLRYLSAAPDGSLSFRMEDEDVVYGLGEQIRGINKRGWIYENRNTDETRHTEDRRSLYASHNFLIIDGSVRFGLFLDAPSYVTFDVGYTEYDKLNITFADPHYTLYIFEEKTLEGIAGELRRLTGRSYIPPKWAFGFGQSRWGYRSEDDIRKVVSEYRKAGIPVDAVYMDIDYMDGFRDFTVREDTFPDFPAFVEEMRRQHVHLVPIIDAAVKADEGYFAYDEMMKGGYYCRKKDGSPFVCGVWPGRSLLPDFLNEDASRWFGDSYGRLFLQGIDGIWNDMNEPALFYAEDHLNEVLEKLPAYRDMNLDIQSYNDLKRDVLGIACRREDFETFTHEFRGQTVENWRVHNLYGFYMTRSAAEGMKRFSPDKRMLLFSRSSYIGMHRYAGIWYGDNCAWWSHLLQHLKSMANANMCGFLYSGADIGGFGSDTTEDLMLRWLQFGIFSPLFRNHVSMHARNHDLYLFGERFKDAFAKTLRIRYMLLPYIYSEFMKAALSGGMYAKPLSFVWEDDERCRRIEDQIMIGESLMAAPVYAQNASGRYVYLPEDMLLVRMKSPEDFETEEMSAGDHYVRIDLEQTAFFVRKGHAVVYARSGFTKPYVTDVPTEGLDAFAYGDNVTYDYYDDDGTSPADELEGHVSTLVF
ncbi:MAG: alpha-glucosidase [Lachnospiraceae bacterium]|nr:alpha-glucosidase [Lachnospiraceae bacterium]